MSGSIGVYWPDCTQEQEHGGPPFANTDDPWMAWVGGIIANAKAVQSLKMLGAEPLLTHTTEDMKEHDIDWVAPKELEAAAHILRQAIEAHDSRTILILRLYEHACAQFERLRGSPEVALTRDLNDIVNCARYALDKGAAKMTLSFYT